MFLPRYILCVLYAYNAVGSVVANTDQEGFVIRENDFDAYGNQVREQDWTSNNFPLEFGGSQNDLLFSTKERDFSTGLDYFGFRYYDAVLGKFTTRDPSGYPDGPNNYLYCKNNPINSIDPLGLEIKIPDGMFKPINILNIRREDPEQRKAYEEEKESAKFVHDLHERHLEKEQEKLDQLVLEKAGIDLSKLEPYSVGYNIEKARLGRLQVDIEKSQNRIKTHLEAMLVYQTLYVKDPSWRGHDLASQYEREMVPDLGPEIIAPTADLGVGAATKQLAKAAVTKYSTSKASKELGKELTRKIGARVKGMQAAHLIPTNIFTNRSAAVQKAIRQAQEKFNTLLGEQNRNKAINGFWAKAGHLGTHKDRFFLEMGKAFRHVKDKKDMIKAMNNLKARVMNGEFVK